MQHGKNIWIDSLVHDPDLLEFVCKKIGIERIVMGSDYPFPLGEVPEAGKMLCSDDKLASFLTWDERAQMLAGNAIRFLGLEERFEKRFQDKMMELHKFKSVPIRMSDAERKKRKIAELSEIPAFLR